MIEFKQTDFPVPVRPAIRRCGSFAKSATIGAPPTSLPRKIGIAIFSACAAHSSITSRRRTSWRL